MLPERFGSLTMSLIARISKASYRNRACSPNSSCVQARISMRSRSAAGATIRRCIASMSVLPAFHGRGGAPADAADEPSKLPLAADFNPAPLVDLLERFGGQGSQQLQLFTLLASLQFQQ